MHINGTLLDDQVTILSITLCEGFISFFFCDVHCSSAILSIHRGK